jgi:hypothetical protein
MAGIPALLGAHQEARHPPRTHAMVRLARENVPFIECIRNQQSVYMERAEEEESGPGESDDDDAGDGAEGIDEDEEDDEDEDEGYDSEDDQDELGQVDNDNVVARFMRPTKDRHRYVDQDSKVEEFCSGAGLNGLSNCSERRKSMWLDERDVRRNVAVRRTSKHILTDLEAYQELSKAVSIRLRSSCGNLIRVSSDFTKIETISRLTVSLLRRGG